MTRHPRRLLISTLSVLMLVGACDGDDDGPDAGGGAGATTTTTSRGAGDATTTTTGGAGSATSSTTAAGGSATTASTVAPTTSAPPAASPDSEGVIEVRVVGGNVEGGVRRETVKQGAQVTIRATSDVADDLHVHTYDLKVSLVPGRSSDITFLAKVPGVFEVELENRHKKVLELEVRP